VTVHLGPEDVELIGPGDPVQHPRKRFGERSIDYRHYIPELARKPQALRQVAPELMRDLGEPFGSAWKMLVDEQGPRQASRIFAKLLGVIETRGIVLVAQEVACALATGEPLLLALAAAPASSSLSAEQVPLTLRDNVAAGCASDYDRWLVGGAA
jgi:hypothetical protein